MNYCGVSGWRSSGEGRWRRTYRSEKMPRIEEEEGDDKPEDIGREE